MTDTLVVAGYTGDGFPTLTINTSSGIFLAPDFSFGELALSGSLFDRYADKQITLPLVVKATTRASMRSLVEQAALALSRQFFTLTWTPSGGLPIVYDCYDAQVGQQWDLQLDNQSVRRVDVTFSTRPFGSSPDVANVFSGSTTGTTTGTSWMAKVATGVQGSAPGLITDMQITGSDVSSALIHTTPAGRLVNLPAPLTIDGTNAWSTDTFSLSDYFDGTFTVWLGLNTVPSGTHVNYVTVNLTESLAATGDVIGTGTVTGAFVIDDESTARRGKLVAVGQVTLPLAGSLGGPRNLSASITVTDENGSLTGSVVTLRDLLLLNTDGTTIYQAGYDPQVRLIIDAPEPRVDLNAIYVSFGPSASNYRIKTRTPDRVQISGPPMQVHPQENAALVYTPRATSPAFTSSYVPRWLSERTV